MSLAAASWSLSSLLAADFTACDCTTCLEKEELPPRHLEYFICFVFEYNIISN